METKTQILGRLGGRKRTVTQLSEELGLAKSTVSQHMAELQRMGKVRESDNSWFRKTKYFEIIRENEPQTLVHLQYRLGVSLLAIFVSVLLLYQLTGAPQNLNAAAVQLPNSVGQPSGVTTAQAAIPQTPPAYWSEIGVLVVLITAFAIYFVITARRLLKTRAAHSTE